MCDTNANIVTEEIFRDFNNVAIQVNLADSGSSDLRQLIREREELKEKLEEKEKEINSLKAVQYDMLTKLDESKKTRKQSISVSNANSSPRNVPKRNRRASIAVTAAAGLIREKSSVKEKDRILTPAPEIKENGVTIDDSPPKHVHPKISAEKEITDSYTFYQEIAKNAPNLKLSTVLEAENKFLAADDNKDGVIDCEELDKFLSSYNVLLTKKQVHDMLQEIDVDNNGTIDFFEALKIIERLWTNKPNKIPDEIKKNRSNVCSLQ